VWKKEPERKNSKEGAPELLSKYTESEKRDQWAREKKEKNSGSLEPRCIECWKKEHQSQKNNLSLP